MRTVFRLIINSCKIMQDSNCHAITQTIHTNLVGLFCDAGYDNFDAANSHPTSPFRGRDIVDLDFMYKQLHKPCNPALSLTQYQGERQIGLTNILYLSLKNCSTVTMVKTSIYNVKVAHYCKIHQTGQIS